MRHFPIFLGTEDTKLVIVGGGEQAAQKLRLLGRSSAQIAVLADALCPELEDARDAGRISHAPLDLTSDTFQDARLAVIATGCAALDAVAADLARQGGALVNVVDRPALSDFIMPAIVDRDPVVVAIGTEGTAPVLARRIKTRLEQMLEPNLGRFAAALGRLRPAVSHGVAPRQRRGFWEWVTAGPRNAFAGGDEHTALIAIQDAIASGGAPDEPIGRISVLDPGQGVADLMTMRAVERLQGADLILYDRNCPLAILDLARRDAERGVLEDSDEPIRWRAERGGRIAAKALEDGLSVVWLSADMEAMRALARQGLDFEDVPAVSVVPRALPVVACAEDG